MGLIIEHGALMAAAWLSLNVLFVIGWGRLHTAGQHSRHQTKATIIEFRPKDGWARSRSNDTGLASRCAQIACSN
jgi:hypothetical protein